MSGAEILERCRRAGVVLAVDGGRLAYDAPAGVLTGPLFAELVANKAEVVALVSGEPLAAEGPLSASHRTESPGCPACGATGSAPPACPRCGAVTPHPPSMDHDTGSAWWCGRCLNDQILTAARER